jgi:hypothetical protein
MNKLIILIIGAVLAISAVGVYALDVAPPINSNSTTVNVMTTFTASSSGNGMPPGCVLASTNSSDGFSVKLFLPTSATLGCDVCIGTIVTNDGATSPNVQDVSQLVNITDSSGRLFATLAMGDVVQAGTLHRDNLLVPSSTGIPVIRISALPAGLA